jgi:hypothetical protein
MAAALALLLAAAAPVAEPPKAGPVEHLHKQVVQAIRNCPEGEDGEIVVCSRDRGVAEAYRLPKMDGRFATLRPSGRGTAAAAAAGADLGASGTGSCSAAGAGGATGCQLQMDKQWGDWKKQRQADGQPFPW